MSYPPPPGLNASQLSSQTPTQSNHALPARPPGPPPSFKPSISADPTRPSATPPTTGGGSAYSSSFTAFKPRSVASTAPPQGQGWHSASPTIAAGPTAPPGYPNQSSYGQQYQSNGYSQQSYGGGYPQQGGDNYAQPTPPQIRNPFAAPGSGIGSDQRGNGSSYDPEIEAQIAQWQSAYAPRDEMNIAKGGATAARPAGGANAIPLGNKPTSTPLSSHEVASHAPSSGGASVVAGADGKAKTVVRSGGGQTWQDPTLLEWDQSHFRLFVGNLAGEVTDDSLMKAFSKYPSVSKAKVIRDKVTTKSKGFGFVSIADGEEYFQAYKEMQGKYIGSHPVQLKKSTTEIKAVARKDHRKGKPQHNKNGGGAATDRTGAGVQKKQAKTKGGLKILG